jgi:hypothetical protein
MNGRRKRIINSKRKNIKPNGGENERKWIKIENRRRIRIRRRYRISMRTVGKRKELKLILKCMIYYKISHS